MCDFSGPPADELLAALEHLSTYRGERPFQAWLLSFTRNLALNQFRHRRRAPNPELLARTTEAPVDAVERREALGDEKCPDCGAMRR